MHLSIIWSRDQTRVHAMETQGVPYSQEIFCATISRKEHGNSFLGLRRCSAFGILISHRTAITSDTYGCTMVVLRENIKQKHGGKLSAGVLLLHDNSHARKSRISRAAKRKCGFLELNHPPFSPDLAPSDYFLFWNLKKFLRGRRFPYEVAVIEAVTGYFDTQDVSFFLGYLISGGEVD